MFAFVVQVYLNLKQRAKMFSHVLALYIKFKLIDFGKTKFKFIFKFIIDFAKVDFKMCFYCNWTDVELCSYYL